MNRTPTPQRILEATLDVLSQRGFSATSTVVVCEHAHVARGTLLHHFPTRDELLRCAAQYLFKDLRQNFFDKIEQVEELNGQVIYDSVILGYQHKWAGALIELFAAARIDARLAKVVGPIAQEQRDDFANLAAEIIPTHMDIEYVKERLSLMMDLMLGINLREEVLSGYKKSSLRFIRSEISSLCGETEA